MASSTPASVASYVTNDQTRNVSWVQQAFLLTNENLNDPDISGTDQQQRLFTTAAWCYSDTSPGGNWALNPAPQFCRYADVTMGGAQELVSAGHTSSRTTMYTSGSFGEGRYYNEVIEGNAQYVTMAFGIPAFNSMTSFFGNFYDARLGSLVRTGRLPGLLFKAGQITGSLLALPFKPLILVSQIVKSAYNIPSTSYAYFRPNMTMYWQAVSTMVNAITANLGLHERDLSDAQKLAYTDPNGATTGTGPVADIGSDVSKLHAYLPAIYSDDGSGPAGRRGAIDVYALASRSQALSYAFYTRMQDAMNSADNLQDLKTNLATMLQSGQTLEAAKNRSQSQALQDYYSGTFSKSPNGSGPGWPPGQQSTDGNSDTDTDVATIAGDIKPTPSTTGGQTTPPATNDAITQADTSVNTQAGNNASQEPGVIASIANWFKSLMQGLTSDLQDGSQYVTFKVDYGGPIGESFGNSFRPSEIEEQINSKVSAARVAEYNFADGKLVGGLLGSVVTGALNAVKDAATGILSGIHLSGLAAFAGAAYVDIPRMFDSSNTTMPSQSFTMHLRSPYGHKLALLQNLYIPLAAILAGVMPRATGPASYNAPFCCQLFAQGRMQVRYGMITSLSIQRGMGNIGFTKEGLPLGIDVTFEVTDFSSVMYMPIVAASGFLDHATMAVGQVTGTTIGAIAGAAGANTNGVEGGKTGEEIAAYFTSGMYSDDSIFSDYMAILGGLSFQDQIYPFRKWSIARDRQVLDYDTAKSPYHWALMLNGSIPGRIISGLVRGTDRP